MSRAKIIALIRARRSQGITRRLPRAQHPTLIAVEYYKAIHPLLVRARELVDSELMPLLGGLLEESREARGDAGPLATMTLEKFMLWEFRTDAGGKKVNETMGRISKKYFEQFRPQRLEEIASRFANRTNDFQRAQFQAQSRAALGVDLYAGESWLAPRVADFVAENVALITSVPNQYFDEIEKAVTAGVRNGVRHEELAAQISERFGVSESRAKLIARDQVGKFYGEVNKVRQTKLGVERFIWRTSGDERVRDEHVELDGQSFKWSDPPDEGIPGHPINCRCYADPDFTSLLEDL